MTDLSKLDFDASVNSDEFKDIILEKLSNILQSSFKDTQKQTIHLYKDRINFACPYCGDSVSKTTKKRGNLILTGKYANHFKCYNCGYFTTIHNFFKSFNNQLDLSVINYIQQHITDFSKSYKYDASYLFDVEKINNYAIKRDVFKQAFNLKEVRQTKAYNYLINRLQYNYNNFLYNEYTDELYVLNLTTDGNIIGCQKRHIFKKSDNKYLTLKLDKIYDKLNELSSDKTQYISEEIPDDISSISTIFNICNLNYNAPITLFEGPMDSFLFKNSIASAGISKTLPIDINVRYFLDSDAAGVKKSVDLLNNGESVFLWKKFISDYNLPSKKKWDLNDVAIYCKNNNIKIQTFEPYFSNDMFDMIDI